MLKFLIVMQIKGDDQQRLSVPLLMSMGWDCVSDLRPPTGLLFILQMVVYMNMEGDGGMILAVQNRRSWTKNLSQFHFVHHKSHTDWARIQNSAVRGRGLTACASITNQKCKNLWIIISTISNEWRCSLPSRSPDLKTMNSFYWDFQKKNVGTNLTKKCEHRVRKQIEYPRAVCLIMAVGIQTWRAFLC
jgi:hypothetical protein